MPDPRRGRMGSGPAGVAGAGSEPTPTRRARPAPAWITESDVNRIMPMGLKRRWK